MKLKSILSALLLACVGAGALRAQWLTQTLHLRAGWNAVYLHVDPSHATIDELVAPDPLFAVEEVWMWRPDLSGQQFSTSPLAPTTGDSRWLSWSRQEGEDSALQRLAPGIAYLVRIKASVPTYDWAILGKPVAKRTQWTSSGLNFLGFPIPTDASPTFRTDNRGNVGFFALAPLDFLRVAEFYKYDAGDLGPNNPALVFAPRTTRMARGEAYWIKSGDYYNRYFGPLEISSPEAGQLFYGDKGRVIGLRVRNVTSTPITVNLSLLASEAAPTGQAPVTGVVPLIIREARTNLTQLGYPYSRLGVGTPRTWTLAAAGNNGSDIEIVLGIDRSQLTGNPGDLVAGILRFKDSLGLSQIDIGVSGNVGSYAGLWIGDAVVTQVGQYLKKYERDANNTPVTATDGKYQVASLDTSLTGVSRGYPLRLIVHNPASGPATLLQQVYVGVNAKTNQVVARFEGALDPSQLRDSRRISAPHLPFSASNPGWSFSGPVNPTTTVSASVTNRFDDGESNPFLHAYHPDHDNLDSDRAKTLSQGAESYSIVRTLTLQFAAPADHFEARTSAAQTLTGNYAESMSLLGLARGGGSMDTRTFEARGSFSLQRIVDVPVLSNATTP